MIAQVPPIRQLDPLADVPYEFISREQFTNELMELAFSEVPAEQRAAEERFYKRLGLLSDDADLDQLLINLYGAGVAAYYRFDNKTMYLVEDGQQELSASDKVAVAHEYTHALEDQHFEIGANRITDLTQGDAALGQLGAVEGDATQTMQLWSQDNLTLEEIFQVGIESLGQLSDPTLANTPWILRRQLEYPYSEGYSFIKGLYDEGGFDAVNGTLKESIPASTEQVLHPEKYLANEAPVEIDAPDLSASIGAGWTMTYQQTMGELLMQVFAAGDETPTSIPGIPVPWAHAETVAGWGGDRLNMYENGDQWIIDWQTAWDTQPDADEFSARVIELQPRLQGHLVVEPGSAPNGVRVLLATDVATMDLVQPPR